MVIQTVLGDIAPEKLGFCHSHEHILLAKGKSFELSPALCMDDTQKSLEELVLFAKAGGGAVVDAQPVGCGRMSRELESVSLKSGVHIIASTGFHKMVFYKDDHWIFSCTEEEAAFVFTHELQRGMFPGADDGLPRDFHESRAGVIKTALDAGGFDAQYEKLFSAAAKAHAATGAPLLIHVDYKSEPLKLDEFLAKRGVAPQKRIYCHLDRAVHDTGVHTELLKRGCYLEYDTINRLKYHDDNTEAGIICAQIEAGFESRILLGLDSTNQRLSYYGGDTGLDYIITRFIPLLKAMGCAENTLAGLMVGNPSRAFAF